ncbi:MAG: tRNA-(ms[2]io[6]A)-hydroxylase [Legionellaceae bacterium]|nr:tRNA-(ms[2]io[6]A)-hydroxylase [Legionellaceae bacterium]|tara:strand:+ start:522 stop:1166 length:645 start_codon:yes stop_codon:yes gene_type:complete
MKIDNNLDNIFTFLGCRTPDVWCQKAVENQEIMLIDHAHCEKKAAATAIHMMHRYPERLELLNMASRLAREELRHFEQVIKLMKARAISFQHLTPARYAEGLRSHVSTSEPKRLVDLLIIGAFIEARSCERFHALIPYLDDELAKFYRGLFASEARHFQQYLSLAKVYAEETIDARVAFFREKEAALILTPDDNFRFHSGVPVELNSDVVTRMQ